MASVERREGAASPAVQSALAAGRLDPTKSERLANLAARPVQLKMLLEILPSTDQDPDSMSVAILYAEFVDLIIRREMEKIARSRFDHKKRRTFVRELAWWMWTKSPGLGVQSSRLPRGLFTSYAGPDDDLADVTRDLLSACFLESKPPEGYC